MSLALALLGALRAALRSRTDLALENLALRQQLALLRRRSKRPQFGRLDRAFWMWLSNCWAGWRGALHLVRPETVIRWHRQGFHAFWTWKSRRGRPVPIQKSICGVSTTGMGPSCSSAFFTACAPSHEGHQVLMRSMADPAARREASICCRRRDRVRWRGARTDGGARPGPAARRSLLRVQIGGLLGRQVRPC